MHYEKRIHTCAEVIHYDARTFRQPLQSANRKGLPHVEYTKEYKAREKCFPSERDRDERNQLPGNFINHHELRILLSIRSCG